MAKGTLIVILLTSLSFGLLAQAPPWLWVTSGMDQAPSYAGDVAVDKNGDIYMTGEFTGTLSIGGQTLSSNGMKDVFIAKYNPSGGLLWVRSGGSVFDEAAPGVVIDRAGNVYIAGGFADQAFFDHLTVTSEGQKDIFIAKYDSDGVLLWLKSFGGLGNDLVGVGAGRGLSLDQSDNLYLTGSFSTPFVMGGTALPAWGSVDVFVAKLDTSAKVIWAKSAGSYSVDFGNDISLDALGNVYITGSFDGKVRFDTIELTSKGFSDMFVAKYDSSGNVLWAKTAGGNLPDGPSALVCDENLNVYVLGHFNSSNLYFGSTIIKNHGFFDIFLAKYNSTGALVWAKSYGTYGGDFSSDITFGNSQIYITGHFYGRTQFDGNTLLSHEGKGGEDGFVAKFDQDGAFQWAKNAGGFGSDRLFGIALDPNGFPVVTGRINSPAAPFGNTNVHGPNAPFIAKLGLFPEHVVETAVQGIRIYPNPAKGTLQVSPDNGIRIRKAAIQDMQGRLVREYTEMGGGLLDVSDLPQGMYLLYLDTDSGRVLHRFLKETAD